MSNIPAFMRPKEPTWQSGRVIELNKPMPVARDRYVKGIKEKDQEKAGGQYVRSGAAGALLGAALRKTGSRKAAVIKGVAAGLAAEGATRVATARTKDAYGDRSTGGKVADKIVAPAIAAGALVAGNPKIRKKLVAAKGAAQAAVRTATARVAQKGPRVAGEILRGIGRGMVGFSSKLPRKALLHGAALAGGIATADAVTSAVTAKKGERSHAVKEGLAKGALYGSTLAVAEPAILSGLRRANVVRRRVVPRRIVPLSARVDTVAFRGREQLYTDDHPTAKRVFADPLKVASGQQRAYTIDEQGQRHDRDYGVRHAQVLRAAMNKGRGAYKWGSRAGRAANDVKDAIQGKRKVDERGRPLKREWEKSYFRNMVGSAAVAGGYLAHASAMKRIPRYRNKVQDLTKRGTEWANRVVPGSVFSARAGRPIAFARTPQGIVAFDWSAPEWDVRDQRGRSARVFAPGARARDRREKFWHERTGNLRKLAVAGALVAAAGGGAVGYKIGQNRGVKSMLSQRAKKAAATRQARTAAAVAAENATIERMKRPNS